MEGSIIANHEASIVLTWLSKPKPNRSVQLMTEVKCGIHASPGIVSVLNKPRIRGTLRYDTTACMTKRTHSARVSLASERSMMVAGTGVKCFF